MSQSHGSDAPQPALLTANADSLAPDEIGHATILRKPVDHDALVFESRKAPPRSRHNGCVARRDFHAGGLMTCVLLVDDDTLSLNALEAVFESRGFNVLLARNGVDALATAIRMLPDLVVTDWEMPLFDGVTLCERLRSVPGLARIPVVLTSGKMRPADGPQAWDVFLQKPLDLRLLEPIFRRF
ncbi:MULTISPECIES: PleD family two-component system response regulator [unclassified Caballeronia]|uniref:response regulator n=1 Tax=unclassified Caballeronia TaxID=2646786 RepID=UPI002029A574|nr:MULTISPECIES: response regulator [unclassified Caballeronia]